MPDTGKKEMYDLIEKSGNVRIERVAFGMVDAEKREQRKMFARFTGKANHVWCVDTIKNLGKVEATALKSGDGTPITRLHDKGGMPSIIAIGNTDLLVVGYDRGQMHDDLVDELLAIRAKKKPSATTGLLKDRLARIPDKAIAFAVGDLPGDFKRELGLLFAPTPSNLTAFIERMPMGLDLQVETSMANREEADKLVQKIGAMRKEGIDALKKAAQQPLPMAPQLPFQAMINVMESLQVQSKAEQVQARAFVPDTLAQQLGQMMMMFGGMRAEPLPPPKVEKK